MADIRINSLSTTASSTASDDFIAVDGTTNGTRKLNAFSPSFGGNATVGGTLGLNGAASGAVLNVKETAGVPTALNLTNRNSTQTWSVAVDAAAVDDKLLAFISSGSVKAAIGATSGNLLIGGTTDISGTGGLKVFGTTASTSTSTGALVVSGGVGVAGNVNVGGTLNQFGTIGTPSQVAVAMQNTSARFRERNVTNDFAWTTNIDDGWVQDNSSYASWGVRMGGGSNTFRIGQKGAGAAGDLSTLLLLNSSGNVLLGTTTDSSNGKLQLATHTTSAGGIGFGTETALYRAAAGSLVLDYVGASAPTFNLAANGSIQSRLFFNGSNTFLESYTSHSLIFRTNQTTALTINSSQQVQVNSSTASTSTSSGALVVSGGVGVAKAVYAGSEIVSNDTNGAGFRHSAAAGLYRGLKLQTSGSDRWLFASNDASESGSNAGSDLVLFSYADAGTFLREDLKITRSTGAAKFGGSIQTSAPTGGAGAWELGVANSVTPTSPNRTLTVEIGGTVYYIHAKTTND